MLCVFYFQMAGGAVEEPLVADLSARLTIEGGDVEKRFHHLPCFGPFSRHPVDEQRQQPRLASFESIADEMGRSDFIDEAAVDLARFRLGPSLPGLASTEPLRLHLGIETHPVNGHAPFGHDLGGQLNW